MGLKNGATTATTRSATTRNAATPSRNSERVSDRSSLSAPTVQHSTSATRTTAIFHEEKKRFSNSVSVLISSSRLGMPLLEIARRNLRGLPRPRTCITIMAFLRLEASLRHWIMLSEAAVLASSLLGLAFVLVAFKRITRRRDVIAFFHPYCNDGGGGERVLWCAVQALHASRPDCTIAVYTGDAASKEDILRKAKERFGLDVDASRLTLVRLGLRWMVEARPYPVFTLLGQSFGTVVLACEALFKLVPSMFIDTMGCAFTYPVARYVFGCKVACYTHYPTISTDMLGLVERREQSYNNNPIISRSPLLSGIKLVYYRLFAVAYGAVGRCAHSAMSNSSWTAAHIEEIWGVKAHVVYPPCNTDELQKIPYGTREPLIMSVGQYRPEKNHILQVECMSHLMKIMPRGSSHPKMLIVGSCRNSDDEERAAAVQRRVVELGLEGNVEIRMNVAWPELYGLFGRASAGIHTMRNEHFGINVVEFMASGVIPVSNNSGGPQTDIVDVGANGFLATTAEEYAECLKEVLCADGRNFSGMQADGRRKADLFSDERFRQGFVEALERGIQETKKRQ